MEILHQYLQRAAQARQENEHWAAIEWYTRLLAETSPDPTSPVHTLRLKALAERGTLLEHLGEPEAALAGYNQYYLEAGSSAEAVNALVKIGLQHGRMGQNHRALQALREALHLAEALNLSPGRAEAWLAMGEIYITLGQVEEALSNMRNALAIFQQLGNTYASFRTWNNMGIAHHNRGEIDKAIHAYEQALELARTIGDWETAIILNNLGETYQDLFDMDQALGYHYQALEIAERTNLEALEDDLRRNLGVELCFLGRVTEALDYLCRALEISRASGNVGVEMQTRYSLALAELQNNNLTAAHDHAQELLRLTEQHRATIFRASAFHALGLYHACLGENEAAEEMWQQALFLAHETGQRLLLWRIHAGLARVAATPALATVHRRIAGEVIQQIVEPIEDPAVLEKFFTAPPVQAILSG